MELVVVSHEHDDGKGDCPAKHEEEVPVHTHPSLQTQTLEQGAEPLLKLRGPEGPCLPRSVQGLEDQSYGDVRCGEKRNGSDREDTGHHCLEHDLWCL